MRLGDIPKGLRSILASAATSGHRQVVMKICFRSNTAIITRIKQVPTTEGFKKHFMRYMSGQTYHQQQGMLNVDLLVSMN